MYHETDEEHDHEEEAEAERDTRRRHVAVVQIPAACGPASTQGGALRSRCGGWGTPAALHGVVAVLASSGVVAVLALSLGVFITLASLLARLVEVATNQSVLPFRLTPPDRQIVESFKTVAGSPHSSVPRTTVD